MRSKLLPFCLLLLSCGPSLTPAQHVERETCLFKVFREFDARADEECPKNAGPWDDCPKAKQIETDMAAAQRACIHTP